MGIRRPQQLKSNFILNGTNANEIASASACEGLDTDPNLISDAKTEKNATVLLTLFNKLLISDSITRARQRLTRIILFRN